MKKKSNRVNVAWIESSSRSALIHTYMSSRRPVKGRRGYWLSERETHETVHYFVSFAH